MGGNLQRGYEIKSNNIVFSVVHYNKQKVRLELRGIFFQLNRKDYSYFDEITNHENVNYIVTPVYT